MVRGEETTGVKALKHKRTGGMYRKISVKGRRRTPESEMVGRFL